LSAKIAYSVFTKPWPTLSLPRLGELVQGLGFDGVELPVRPGFQVEPDRVQDLPKAAAQLAAHGIKIFSVAAPSDEPTIAACAAAGVPTLRVMVRIGEWEHYLEAEGRFQRELEALLPLLERYGVRLGIQNHCGRFVNSAVGLRRLVEPYDPDQVGVVWDAAHEALAGGPPDLALDAAWSHLCMVNLKNGYWRRMSGPEAAQAHWQVYWTDGRHGLASWPLVVEELVDRGYQGVLCLTAEYSDRDAVERLIAQDIAYARALFEE
jgi:sugar phosphate isomerase/epimerase